MVAAVIAVFSAGMIVGRWSKLPEIAECKITIAEIQSSIVEQSAAGVAETIETIRRENETTRKTTNSAVARRAALHDYFGGLRIDAASAGIHSGALSTAAGTAMDFDDAAGECRPCPAEFEAKCAQDALTVLEWQSWYNIMKNDRSDRAESDDLGGGGG